MTQEDHNRTVKSGVRGGLLFTLAILVGFFLLIPRMDDDPGIAGRLRLAVECSIFPGLLFFLMILRVGAQRFGNAAEDPTKVLASTEGMKVDLRVLSNTHEQLILFLINTLGLSVLLPFGYLSLLPAYSALFVAGRIVYWVGYRKNVLLRGPGFAMGLLPAGLGLLYCAFAVFFRTGPF
ncbi:MAG: MAPEG family protein [Myxococcota bacterium]|nr:MAPEG family protein [Myxococcota bacterium]